MKMHTNESIKRGKKGSGFLLGALDRLKHSRRLRFTRAGKWFFWLTVAMGVAAVNSGNNMLYMLVSVQLSMIIISGILADMNLKGLQIERYVPSRVVAREHFLVELTIECSKRFVPSFALKLVDIVQGPGALKRKRRERTKGPCAFVSRVGPGEKITTRYELALPRRGLFRFDRLLVLTSFPFGFFETWIEFRGSSDILALPYPAGTFKLPLVRSGRGMGHIPRAAPGRGNDFFALRELKPGDDIRAMAHKASARMSKPIMIEMEDNALPRLEITLDNYLGNRDKAVSNVDDNYSHDAYVPYAADPMERLVSRAAALAGEASRQGFVISLSVRGGMAGPGFGRPQLLKLLSLMALLEQGERTVSIPRADPLAERIVIGMEV
ncbi:MAG: DUF58 domain-containing protein [Deltaproteobacteria bacterium]|nr:DUF58 domain-containing protein [Deltaproteobacteria bacterium]